MQVLPVFSASAGKRNIQYHLDIDFSAGVRERGPKILG
jgi:hypothetical protein